FLGTTEVVPFPVLADRSVRATRDEGAAGVAGPDTIRGPAMAPDVAGERVGLGEEPARALFCRGIVNNQIDALVATEIADDLRVNPGDRFEFARPIAFKMRPGKPGRFVRLPFRGHAKPE